MEAKPREVPRRARHGAMVRRAVPASMSMVCGDAYALLTLRGRQLPAAARVLLGYVAPDVDVAGVTRR